MSDVSTGTEHKVWEGKVACGFTREMPDCWPPGHYMVRTRDAEDIAGVTCKLCVVYTQAPGIPCACTGKAHDPMTCAKLKGFCRGTTAKIACCGLLPQHEGEHEPLNLKTMNPPRRR